MNKALGRLLLASVCAFAVASASRGADAGQPSHVLLDTNFGDLAQQQDLLARRLHHTENLQKFQDLLKDEGLQKLLKELKPGDIEKIKEVVNKNPAFLDDPRFHDLLNKAEAFKQSKGAGLSEDEQKEAVQKAKELFGLNNSSSLSPGGPTTGASMDLPHTTPDMLPLPKLTPPLAPKSEGLSRDLAQDLKGILKNINQSDEGKELRKVFQHDLNIPKDASSPASSSSTNFLEKLITPRQATWLTRHLTWPSWLNFDGWSSHANLTASPSLGGASSGGLDAAVWIIALSLFGIAAVLVLRAASQRTADAQRKAWSAGPWPVHPSRVSTREDLIRAFEHLAFLCLGPTAGRLNHLAVADRLGETAGGRGGPAERLARLYEQARYAPPEEPLPAEELAAARDNLSTLAGAAA